MSFTYEEFKRAQESISNMLMKQMKALHDRGVLLGPQHVWPLAENILNAVSAQFSRSFDDEDVIQHAVSTFVAAMPSTLHTTLRTVIQGFDIADRQTMLSRFPAEMRDAMEAILNEEDIRQESRGLSGSGFSQGGEPPAQATVDTGMGVVGRRASTADELEAIVRAARRSPDEYRAFLETVATDQTLSVEEKALYINAAKQAGIRLDTERFGNVLYEARLTENISWLERIAEDETEDALTRSRALGWIAAAGMGRRPVLGDEPPPSVTLSDGSVRSYRNWAEYTRENVAPMLYDGGAARYVVAGVYGGSLDNVASVQDVTYPGGRVRAVLRDSKGRFAGTLNSAASRYILAQHLSGQKMAENVRQQVAKYVSQNFDEAARQFHDSTGDLRRMVFANPDIEVEISQKNGMVFDFWLNIPDDKRPVGRGTHNYTWDVPITYRRIVHQLFISGRQEIVKEHRMIFPSRAVVSGGRSWVFTKTVEKQRPYEKSFELTQSQKQKLLQEVGVEYKDQVMDMIRSSLHVIRD